MNLVFKFLPLRSAKLLLHLLKIDCNVLSMSKKLVLSILALTAFTFLTGVSFFLSQKQILTQKKVVNTQAAETEAAIASGSREVTVGMLSDVADIPVAAPDTSLPDAPENSACTGKNSSKEWTLGQHFNDYSICRSNGLDASKACPQASFAKNSPTARICYWGNEKRSELAINTENMLYKGCYISRTDQRQKFAGGYSMYHSWNAFNSPVANTPYTFVSNLDKIILSTQFSTDYYANRGECRPEDYPPGVKGDPIWAESRVDGNGDGDTTDKEDAVGTKNAAFSYLSFFIRSNDNKTQIFYQTTLFDNRDFMLKPEGKFISCNFAPDSTVNNFIVVTEPITELGQPFAMPGTGRKSYSFDVLPKIKQWMQHCRPNEPVDLSGLMIGGWNIGNEMVGKQIMTNTVVDPKIQITLKEGINTAFISFPTPAPLSGNAIASFAKVTPSRTNGSATEGVEKAFDNNEGTYWHSGEFSKQWIDLELTKPTTVSGVQLKSRQSVIGYRKYRLLGGMSSDPNTWQTLGEIHGMTNEGQWVTIPSASTQQVKYLRVMSVEGVSHVALYEVKVFETQAVLTPTVMVPTSTPTPSRTPTPTLTPTSAPNQETLVSQGAAVTASNTFSTNAASKIVDGDTNSTWNAGGGAPQWVELNLKQSKTISTIKLMVNQSPTGQTIHRVYAGSTPNPQNLVREFNGSTQYGQTLTATFAQPLQNIQYIRVVTAQSPSWVAWFEIQAFSPPPGQQILPTATPTRPPPTPTPTSAAAAKCPAGYSRKTCTNSVFCTYLGGVGIAEKCELGYNTCCLR